MNFLNPFFLIGGLTLAIPVLIHLVRREKSDVIPFSSLMFLLRVPKQAIRQQKIKNLLLMALRLLILALLVGAFARPYLTKPATPAAASGHDRAVVLMLDNSYSMRYGDHFEKLKAEAIKRIDAMRAGDRMAIVVFNDKATLLATPTSDKALLKASIDTLEPSYAGTRFFEGFSLADRAFSQMGAPEKQLIVISDFQRNGWNRSSRESVIDNDVKTETVDLGIDNSSNVGIDSVALDETIFTRTYTGRVVARIDNHRKDLAVTVPVSLSINDKKVDSKSVTVSPNTTALVEFTGFELPLGYSKGRIKIEAEDPLQVDNEFLFTINRREKLKVLVVDDGRPRQSFFLRQIFTASPDLPFALDTVSGASLTPEQIASHDVLVINDVSRLTDAARNRMDEMRKAGQGQIVILGSNSDLSWWSADPKFPVKATQKIFVSKDRGKPSFAITSYDRNHPIFKAFEKSSALALNSAQFFAYVETEPKAGAEVLAKFENGSPAIVESAPGDRGLLVWTSAMDNVWNDMPLRPLFLPLFSEMVGYLTRYSENRGWYALGEGIPVTAGLETAAAAVIDPQGVRQSLGELSAGQVRYFTPDTPGYYEVRAGRDIRTVAVNPPSAEGNLERMKPEDLLASVQKTKGETRQAGFVVDSEKEDYARRQMGWWYLLLFALLAGVAEIYIANRSQRV